MVVSHKSIVAQQAVAVNQNAKQKSSKITHKKHKKLKNTNYEKNHIQFGTKHLRTS